MRLFDNAAIKIDLFPGRKDKRDGKKDAAAKAEQPRASTPSRDTGGQQVGKNEPRSGVKAAKSTPNMNPQRYQRPNSYRTYSSYSTGSTEYSASLDGSEPTRPGSADSKGTADERTYQPPRNGNVEQRDDHVAQQPQRPSMDTMEHSKYTDSRERKATHQDVPGQGSASERPTGDQRRSRADLQDEWMADQRLRTNITKGAPHSSSHALKHKRSKADMIRATENMARTLSRSPHRSPASRRPLLDESRPGTSSSNGSSRLVPGHNKQVYSSPSRSCQTTADRSGSANSTDSAPQYDPLSPSKIPGVAKKQGKAFNSTIRTSPPLSMEPNKTTWSPTSSVPRRNGNDGKTRTGQDASTEKGDGTHSSHDSNGARQKDSSANKVLAERTKLDSSAGSQKSINSGYSDQSSDGGGEEHSTQRNSIDMKKSDHLSLAQRAALTSSQTAEVQTQPVINRSNGHWATYSRNTSKSSTKSNASNTSVQSKTVAINNGYSKSASEKHDDDNKSAQQTNHRDAGQGKNNTQDSATSDTSYVNYSRTTARGSNADDDTSTETTKRPSPTTAPSQVVDFASQATAPSSSSKSKSNKTSKTINASGVQAPSSKYVDAASSTTSPFQASFGDGKSDPRDKLGRTKARKKNKFSNSSVVNKADRSNSADTTAMAHQTKQIANKADSSNIADTTATAHQTKQIVNKADSSNSADTTATAHQTKQIVNKADSSNSANTTAATHQTKQKKAAPSSLPIIKDNSPVIATTHNNGRAKVVAVNNGGVSAVVPTPMDAAFSPHKAEERKDSGQSDRMDVGGALGSP